MTRGFVSAIKRHPLLVIFLVCLIYLLVSTHGFSQGIPTQWRVFNTVFQSILMEAFPFIFIGVFISSMLHVFVSTEQLVRIFPKNPIAGLALASVAGLFLPVCDCAIVPIVNGLVRKGVPLPCAITFMMAAPIMDPVVIASTYFAFPGKPEIAIYRVAIGLTVAISMGIFLLLFPSKTNPLLDDQKDILCQCGCEESHETESIPVPTPLLLEKPKTVPSTGKQTVTAKFTSVLNHGTEEFFTVGQYLIIGAFISVMAQTLLPYAWLQSLSINRGMGILIMMASAFLLSICSTADAFIARSFSSTFSSGQVMGFMVAGAVMDIKNFSMLSAIFKKGFILRLLVGSYGMTFILVYFLSPFIR